MEGGVAVKMRGNPAHPYSQGELCPKVNHFVERVYSPQRITTPLVRDGAKGEGVFRKATWSEALALVAQKTHVAINEYGGETVLPWSSAGNQGLLQMSSLDRRLFARMGSSQTVGALCGSVAKNGFMATTGSARSTNPMHIVDAKYIVLWGTNTRLTNRHLWPFIEEARSKGAKVVVVDPIRTITADEADWFIQPFPGTDTALMLAMMHVIIRDELCDDEFVAQHTEGFAQLREEVAAWTPERAAAECGVEAADIEIFAREYATAQPAFIRTMIGAEHRENGAMLFRTMACLPTLTGDDSVFDVAHLSQGKPRHALPFTQLGQVLTDTSLTPPISVLYVWNGNPVLTCPNSALTREGLAREDLFTVVSEQFLTDTAKYADVIFPAAMQIEQRDVVPAWGHLYLGWNEAAIAPIGECVPNTELFRRLASAMGYTEPELFESDDSLISSALRGLDLEQLKRDGFIALPNSDEVLFSDGIFGSSSGKAQLVSKDLAYRGLPSVPTYVQSSSRAGSPEFPLVLLTPKQHTRFLNTSYSHLPQHGPREEGPYVEMCASDAA
ncbi:MAG: molybdopterin oxidoreductase family protein, partial [Actinobacteria bacterium]|nr:molybdopterin oxidoreductase family protein [Actinomycetota bacterium]